MKNLKCFVVDRKDFIFYDRNKLSSYYYLTREVFEEVLNITKKYNNKEENVPIEYTIDAFPLEKTGEKDGNNDVYETSSETPVKFPVNKIEWHTVELKL